jgi:hypothetical protein
MKKPLLYWFLGLAAIHLLSFFVVFHPTLNGIIAVAFGVGIFCLTVFRPSLALSILAVEYLVGSKGALFKIGGDASNDGGVAIRIIFFVAFMLGWMVWSYRHKTWKEWRSYLAGRKAYLVLALVLFYGLVVGLVQRNVFVFQDANAWGAWLLLLPALDIVSHEREKFFKTIQPAFVAAIIWMAAFSAFLFFFFTHGYAQVGDSFYLWIRRAGLGEITDYGRGLHRIFFQSQVYAVILLIICFAKSLANEAKHSWAWILGGLAVVQIFISLSRSLWLGAAVGLIGAVVISMFVLEGIWSKRFSSIFLQGVKWIGVVLLSILFVSVVYLVPPSKIAYRASFIEFFQSRVSTQEAAALSRYQLLPILWNKIKERPVLGSGFGATVTYQTKDPRIVAKTGGVYTTYAFEWGWLDHWIKFGIIGIPLVLFILFSLALRYWRSGLPFWMRIAVPASLLGLAVIHLFSPYINHPLGIALLIAGEGLLEGTRIKKRP